MNYHTKYFLQYYLTESLYSATYLIIFIYIGLVVAFFLLLNLFDVRYIKTLSDFKKAGVLFPINLFLLILILSFAGVPPLFGFSIKLLIFLLITNGTSLFYLGVLTTFNFFTLYFYIQNVRYIVNNSTSNYYIYINNFVLISDVVIFFCIGAALINLIGLIYLHDLLIVLTSISFN